VVRRTTTPGRATVTDAFAQVIDSRSIGGHGCRRDKIARSYNRGRALDCRQFPLPGWTNQETETTRVIEEGVLDHPGVRRSGGVNGRRSS
jgi:hypothetical protein